MHPFSLAGRTALVTGASRGIGLGIARALAASGARLILVARNMGAAAAPVDDLRASGADVQLCSFDLRDIDRISDWFAECSARLGQPDILVNAAGMTVRGDTTEFALSDWNQILALNATAVFELSRSFARGLIAQGRSGKVVNIASLMSAASRRGTAAYTASKGALAQLTKALAVDWAEHRIYVNAVAPGYIATELTRPLVQDAQFDHWVKQRCPLGRWGKPEDIAWPVVFLASPASDFITGQILYVDGGWLATF